MPRKRKPPRLYLRERAGRGAQWVILDGTREIGTGCLAGDDQKAEKFLADYLTSKYTAPSANSGRELLVTEALAFYAKERLPNITAIAVTQCSLLHLAEFWDGNTLSDITRQTCRDYIEWRVALRSTRPGYEHAGTPAAGNDLRTLRAAINFYHEEYTLDAVPKVWTPDPSPSRHRWLTRDEIARLVWIAWRKCYMGEYRYRHLARAILIEYYTGTRSAASLRLQWLPSMNGGHFDLENGLLFRRPLGSADKQNKRQPPSKIHVRLLPHLRRWRTYDLARGITSVIHFHGRPVKEIKSSWATVRQLAGLDNGEVVMHTLRHSAATWLMQAGVSIWEASGYLGMSPAILQKVYAHHHADFQNEAATAQPPKRQKRRPQLKIIQGGQAR